MHWHTHKQTEAHTQIQTDTHAHIHTHSHTHTEIFPPDVVLELLGAVEALEGDGLLAVPVHQPSPALVAAVVEVVHQHDELALGVAASAHGVHGLGRGRGRGLGGWRPACCAGCRETGLPRGLTGFQTLHQLGAAELEAKKTARV